MKLLDGNLISNKILLDLKKEINKLNEKINISIIQVGNHDQSNIYIEKKKEFAKKINVEVSHIKFNQEVSEDVLIDKIIKLNNDKNVHGILVQLPLTKNINENNVFQSISPLKDVDGFSPFNRGLLEIGESDIISPTASGIISLFNQYNIDLISKNIVIIGKGKITGRPLLNLLSNKGATVTICDENTKDISIFTINADIIISAVGKKDIINSKIIKKNCILVNVGFVTINGKTYGDYDLNEVSKKAKYSTPIIGGTGPMTVAHLFINLLKCYKINSELLKR